MTTAKLHKKLAMLTKMQITVTVGTLRLSTSSFPNDESWWGRGNVL